MTTMLNVDLEDGFNRKSTEDFTSPTGKTTAYDTNIDLAPFNSSTIDHEQPKDDPFDYAKLESMTSQERRKAARKRQKHIIDKRITENLQKQKKQAEFFDMESLFLPFNHTQTMSKKKYAPVKGERKMIN